MPRWCSTPPARTSSSSRRSGVGQDEVDIVRTADVSIVTLVPGAGDEVQALKAGIMEIADIFVVNKADREGADRLVAAIESNLALQAYGNGEWRPPILKTVATTGQGVPELVDAIGRFRSALARHQRGAAPDAQRVSTARARGAAVHGASRARVLPAELANSRRSSIASPRVRSIPYAAANDLLARALRNHDECHGGFMIV